MKKDSLPNVSKLRLMEPSLLTCLSILVGWGGQQQNTEFGQPTAKAQILNLVRSIRTVAKSMYKPSLFSNGKGY